MSNALLGIEELKQWRFPNQTSDGHLLMVDPNAQASLTDEKMASKLTNRYTPEIPLTKINHITVKKQ